MKKLSSPRLTKDALYFAETVAKKQGQRWTETRAQVFAALLELGRPVTAYQLLEAASRLNKRSMKPTSVYRSLEALMSLGLVAKIESLNAFVACQHPEHDHQHVFLVCDGCGQTDEIADHGISGQLVKGAAQKGFRASRQVLELHGDCKSCRS